MLLPRPCQQTEAAPAAVLHHTNQQTNPTLPSECKDFGGHVGGTAHPGPREPRKLSAMKPSQGDSKALAFQNPQRPRLDCPSDLRLAICYRNSLLELWL